MLYSMTGFGRAEATINGRQVVVEMKSLNGKQFEFRFSLKFQRFNNHRFFHMWMKSRLRRHPAKRNEYCCRFRQRCRSCEYRTLLQPVPIAGHHRKRYL